MTKAEIEVLIVLSIPLKNRTVPLKVRSIESTTLYAKINRTKPELTYGDFWEVLMDLDRRGLVETGEIIGTGDDPPRVTVRCP